MKPDIDYEAAKGKEHHSLLETPPRAILQWAEDFQNQPDPDGTIRTWRWIVYQYQTLIVVGDPSPGRKRDYLALCSRWAHTKERKSVLDSTTLEELSLDEASTLLEQFRRIPAEFFGREFARLFPNIWAWDYGAVDSAKEFRKMVEHAEVIFAVDWNTGAYNFAFGFDALENGANGRGSETFGTITFAVEFDSAQLPRFLAAIKAIKGWAEWNGQIQ